jgi:4'-phosphopantetheinyl transferase
MAGPNAKDDQGAHRDSMDKNGNRSCSPRIVHVRQADAKANLLKFMISTPPILDFQVFEQETARLGAEGLHLWRIRAACREANGPMATGPELERDWSVLSEEERARALRLRNPRRRHGYIRIHAELRRILGLYLQNSPDTLRFRLGPNGKPELDARHCAGDLSVIEFNLTNCGPIALLAISHELPVGLDCERVHTRTDLMSVSRRMFDPKTAQTISEMEEPSRTMEFFRHWTALEAAVKCHGGGLFNQCAGEPQHLQVLHCIPETGYIAAVARSSLPPAGDWRTFDLAMGRTDG